MYYPESALIASENSHLAETIQRVDQFLFERKGNEFYAGTAADYLQLNLAGFEGILNLYLRAQAVSKRKVWLCPVHREELSPVRDDIYHCMSCGQDYSADQCKQSVLYRARRINAPATVTPHKTDEASTASAAAGTEESLAPNRAYPHSQGDVLVAEATVKAAKIGCVGAIVAALIVGVCALINTTLSQNIGNLLSPNPAVIYTETPAVTMTIAVTPDATSNLSIAVPVLTDSPIVTETPSP